MKKKSIVPITTKDFFYERRSTFNIKKIKGQVSCLPVVPAEKLLSKFLSKEQSKKTELSILPFGFTQNYIVYPD